MIDIRAVEAVGEEYTANAPHFSTTVAHNAARGGSAWVRLANGASALDLTP